MQSPVVECHEIRPQKTESEKLHHLHTCKKGNEGYHPRPEFGWPEEWGPEPGEEGHDVWYRKNRMYLSCDEKVRHDLRTGVPVEKNSIRHPEMPCQKRFKASYVNREERDSQCFDPPRAQLLGGALARGQARHHRQGARQLLQGVAGQARGDAEGRGK